MCMCDPFGVGGGERFLSIRRWLVFNEATRGYYFVRLLRRHNVNSNKTTNQIDPYPKTIYVPIPYPQIY